LFPALLGLAHVLETNALSQPRISVAA
jgi:hypothetical protein